ncbi:MAG TPA: CDP-alcohol phosphatidyltransferase family protein [Candidatus Micrarchaeia archaeon]|nr:CDP-alcohol phosphatidyltransferase family protein [Candidatus Micrarchaeia archaeon]
MFSSRLQSFVRGGVGRAVAALGPLNLSPNVLTVIGLGITLAAAVLIALDQLLAAGVVLLLAGSFDLLDGAVARVTGKVHRYGAFLDSTADRYGEGATYLGLLYLFLVHRHRELEPFLIAAALAGSFLVSYVRARAQSLGFTCDGGWFGRPERVVVTAIGLITGQVTIVLWVLAILTNVTAGQRVLTVWRQYRAQLPKGGAGGDGSDARAAGPERPGAEPAQRVASRAPKPKLPEPRGL